MPRPKKPDPETQKLIVNGVDNETIFLLKRMADKALWNDGTDRYNVGDFNRLARGDQDQLLADQLKKIIKKYYIDVHSQQGYEIATQSYKEEQKERSDYWAPDCE